jgi:hypothetical protein
MKEEIMSAGVGALLMLPLQYLQWRRSLSEVARFKAAFDYSPIPLFLKNPAAEVVSVNQAFTDVFGVTNDDLGGLSAAQQHALWESSHAVDFGETDRLAFETDEPVFAVAVLIPPYPDKSKLVHPYTPQEYYILKRRFPVGKFIGKEHWLICSVKSAELLIQFADKARTRYEELQAKSPILSAINELKTVVEQGFSDGSARMERIENRMTKTEAQLHTLQGVVDPTMQQTMPNQFDEFLDPKP